MGTAAKQRDNINWYGQKRFILGKQGMRDAVVALDMRER